MALGSWNLEAGLVWDVVKEEDKGWMGYDAALNSKVVVVLLSFDCSFLPDHEQADEWDGYI